jgi:streptogramin lyase
MKHVALICACSLLIAVSCSSDSDDAGSGTTASADTTEATTTASTTTLAPPLDDQSAPLSINGLVVDGDTVWVASIAADVVLQIDPATGAILQRIPTNGAGPDDVEIGPDGNVYYTGFTNGDIGVIEDGAPRVIAQLEPGANPLGFTSDGTLYVGIAVTGDALYRVPLDGSEPEKIATDLGNMNAFVVTDDDQILGPAAGDDGGVVLRVDPTDGTFEAVVTGLPPVFASAMDTDGNYYVLASATGEVIEVDVDAGTFSTVETVAKAPFDNLAFAQDDTLYVSHFTTPQITAIGPDGTTRVIDVGSTG